MKKVKTGAEVFVCDDSWSKMLSRGGLIKKNELGGYLQNRNPWIFVATVCYRFSEYWLLAESRRIILNALIYNKKTREYALTQKRFLRVSE